MDDSDGNQADAGSRPCRCVSAAMFPHRANKCKLFNTTHAGQAVVMAGAAQVSSVVTGAAGVGAGAKRSKDQNEAPAEEKLSGQLTGICCVCEIHFCVLRHAPLSFSPFRSFGVTSSDVVLHKTRACYQHFAFLLPLFSFLLFPFASPLLRRAARCHSQTSPGVEKHPHASVAPFFAPHGGVKHRLCWRGQCGVFGVLWPMWAHTQSDLQRAGKRIVASMMCEGLDIILFYTNIVLFCATVFQIFAASFYVFVKNILDKTTRLQKLFNFLNFKGYMSSSPFKNFTDLPRFCTSLSMFFTL